MFKLLKPENDRPLSSFAFNGFNLRPCSEATGSIKYDCSEWGRVDIVAHLDKVSFNTGEGGKIEIRSVDFELHIEKGMVRADGTLINWDDTGKVSLGAMRGAMRGSMAGRAVQATVEPAMFSRLRSRQHTGVELNPS